MRTKNSTSLSSVGNRLAVAAVVLGLLGGGILPARVARAQLSAGSCQNDTECTKRFLEALRLYNSKEYEKALPLLQRLYYQDGELGALYPIALTLMQLQRPEEAVGFFQKLLDAGIVTAPKALEEIQKLKKIAEDAARAPLHTGEPVRLPGGEGQALTPELSKKIDIPIFVNPKEVPRSPVPLHQRWQLWLAVGSSTTAVVLITALSAVYAPPAWLGAPTVHPFQ